MEAIFAKPRIIEDAESCDIDGFFIIKSLKSALLISKNDLPSLAKYSASLSRCPNFVPESDLAFKDLLEKKVLANQLITFLLVLYAST